MEYVKIAETSDFETVQKLHLFAGTREILLMKIEDDYFALNNRCPHMGGSLFKGRLIGNEIICPKHHTRFDARTGKVAKLPRILFVQLSVGDAQPYPVKVDGTDILVGIE